MRREVGGVKINQAPGAPAGPEPQIPLLGLKPSVGMTILKELRMRRRANGEKHQFWLTADS